MFTRFARRVACALGSPWATLLALLLIVVWAGSGPLFGFSETWQLVINTTTTIITFLMVFVIQNTQNQDTEEMLAELRELVRAIPQADEGVIPDEDES